MGIHEESRCRRKLETNPKEIKILNQIIINWNEVLHTVIRRVVLQGISIQWCRDN